MNLHLLDLFICILLINNCPNVRCEILQKYHAHNMSMLQNDSNPFIFFFLNAEGQIIFLAATA